MRSIWRYAHPLQNVANITPLVTNMNPLYNTKRESLTFGLWFLIVSLAVLSPIIGIGNLLNDLSELKRTNRLNSHTGHTPLGACSPGTHPTGRA